MTTNQVKFNPKVPAGDYLVQGIETGRGENPGIRMELRDFKENKQLWNLYLLGLWEFQRLDQNHQLSYFQLAGIHGLPYKAWPRDDKLLNSKEYHKQEGTGFCTHTSILFLSWHRPYLALFESILQQAMLYVADQYTPEEGRDQYMTEAKQFRMPYWDWARTNLPVFPDEAIDSESVSVFMPKSMREAHPDLKPVGQNLVEIPNPLYAYKFAEGTDENIKVDSRATTTRYDKPGSAELSATDKKKLLKKNLTDRITPQTPAVNQNIPIEGNLGERVMYLLQAYESFSALSNNKWEAERLSKIPVADRPKVQGPGFGSLEDIHNMIHGLVGGAGNYQGHMKGIDKSAFDPIFWLHHTNIDRLLAIWQGLHDELILRDDPKKPDTWVTSEQSMDGTWVTGPRKTEGPDTWLAPFYKTAGQFWTSRDVKDTKTFGYAYPETKSWNFKVKDAYQNDIKKQILNLYPLTSLGSMIAIFLAGDKKPEADLKTRAKRLAQISTLEQPTALAALSLMRPTSADADPASSFAGLLPPVQQLPSVQIPAGRSLSALAKNNKYLEWLFNIKAEKHSLGGEYLVHVFLGPVPRDELTHLYTASPFHVGTFTPLGQSVDTGCGKCQRDQAARTEITGQIPLTIALVERYFAGMLDGFSENQVVEYLKQNLHWEVTDASGARRERERNVVDGLLVGVSSNEVTVPKSRHDLPQYSQEITLYPEITTKLDSQNGRAEGTGITAGNIFTSSN